MGDSADALRVSTSSQPNSGSAYFIEAISDSAVATLSESHSLDVGDMVTVSGIHESSMSELNGKTFMVTHPITANSVTLAGVDASPEAGMYSAYQVASGGQLVAHSRAVGTVSHDSSTFISGEQVRVVPSQYASIRDVDDRNDIVKVVTQNKSRESLHVVADQMTFVPGSDVVVADASGKGHAWKMSTAAEPIELNINEISVVGTNDAIVRHDRVGAATRRLAAEIRWPSQVLCTARSTATSAWKSRAS